MEPWRRWTPNLRRAILAAHDIASDQGCPAIEAEHLALGILHVEGCAARPTLTEMGGDIVALRPALFEQAARGACNEPTAPDDIGLDLRARRALQVGYVEARQDWGRRGRRFDDDGRVGTQHLLRGLTSPAGEVDASVLRTHGVFYGEVREILRRADDGLPHA